MASEGAYFGIPTPCDLTIDDGPNGCKNDLNLGKTGETCVNANIIFAISSEENETNLDINPNPSRGIVNVSYSSRLDDQEVEIQILDILGSNILQTKTVYKNKAEVQFNLSDYPSGTYITRVIENGIVKSSQLVGIVK